MASSSPSARACARGENVFGTLLILSSSLNSMPVSFFGQFSDESRPAPPPLENLRPMQEN